MMMMMMIMQNKYNHSADNNSSPLQSISQIHILAYKKNKQKPTTTLKFKKVIKLLNSKDSHGYDKICTILLKVNSPFISSPLNYICNKGLIKGIFPD
jgi:hypothetical protein